MEKEKICVQDPSTGCLYYTFTPRPDADYRHEHFHDEVELVHIWSGEILCRVDDAELVLTAGTTMVIGSRVIHRLMYRVPQAEVTYIQMNMEAITASLFPEYALLACILNRNAQKYDIAPAGSTVEHLFLSLLQELKTKPHLYDVAVKGCVYQMISHMCRVGMMHANADVVHQKDFQRILPALLYAKEHYAQRITLDGLCHDLNMDKYHFCKQFKKTTGLTFFEYLGHLRLQNAEELLTSTDKSVTEIGLECGFASLQYFNRFFTEHKGYSPTAYRRMMGEEA